MVRRRWLCVSCFSGNSDQTDPQPTASQITNPPINPNPPPNFHPPPSNPVSGIAKDPQTSASSSDNPSSSHNPADEPTDSQPSRSGRPRSLITVHAPPRSINPYRRETRFRLRELNPQEEGESSQQLHVHRNISTESGGSVGVMVPEFGQIAHQFASRAGAIHSDGMISPGLEKMSPQMPTAEAYPEFSRTPRSLRFSEVQMNRRIPRRRVLLNTPAFVYVMPDMAGSTEFEENVQQAIYQRQNRGSGPFEISRNDISGYFQAVDDIICTEDHPIGPGFRQITYMIRSVASYRPQYNGFRHF